MRDDSDHAAAEARSPAAPWLLSNGRYGVLLDAWGAGYSAFDGFALTRWDPVDGAGGLYLYVRDLESGACWSAGHEPTRTPPEAYRADIVGGRATFVREDDGVELRTGVCVASDGDVELRSHSLTNRSGRPRRLELTTYAEVVLDRFRSGARHPAFSKLFIQTAYLPGHQALLAWRRPRGPEDAPLWLAHRLAVTAAGEEPEYETDRARFLGRGRTAADPIALRTDAPLSGTVGSVLDPAFALRRVVELEHGESAAVSAILAAAHDRDDLEALLRRCDDDVVRRRIFAEARPAPAGAWDALGLPKPVLDRTRAVGASRTADVAAGTGEAAVGIGAEPRPPAPAEPGADARPAGPAESGAEPLLFFNGLGGFSADGSEYVIRLERDDDGLRLPPLPWTNVIANEELGFVVSERGAGCTWAVNSRENRLTPWHNDSVSDPHGEALYLRDEETGAFWSPTPGPVAGPGGYEVRHGFGYTRFRHAAGGLEQDVCQFVARDDPVKLVRVRVTNRGDAARRLSLFSYLEWVLGASPAAARGRVETEHDAATGAVLARNLERGALAGRVAYAAAVAPAGATVQRTTSRTAFLGPYGRVTTPAAVASGAALGEGPAAKPAPAKDPGSVAAPADGPAAEPAPVEDPAAVAAPAGGAIPDQCAAFRVPLEIAPGETAECTFLLGEAGSAEAARLLVRRYGDTAAVEAALESARGFWRDLVSAVRVRTPSPALDVMVNGWLAYQNLSCRIRGRTALYQSGGAYGYRDQLQDASALVYLEPDRARRQILLHAAHQFVEGDVLHWWHPPAGHGIRTRFSDDLLWLPYVTAFYVRCTGDASVLDERLPFLTARPLEPGEDEAHVAPADSGERGSVYEHCCRALDRSLTRGEHGLPLMGTGDWNDGMNRVGREGRGESVWLGFFLYAILNDFIPVCDARGDAARVARYREYRRELARALNDAGWDGAWYRRAFHDDGKPLGSAADDECRIDALAQAWAVLSGAAPPERAERALDAMEEHLVSESEGLIRLLAPPFDRTARDPGYIKGYVPGVRENGGQYTHAAIWAVRALAEAGRHERAARLLEMLSPASRAGTPEAVDIYRAEPYVIAADVYGVAPHVGRGGWTWYTGSAGWLFRVALESVLGLELRGGATLALRPCIPDDWPGFELRYRLPDRRTVYEIEVRRTDEPDAGTRATVDGGPAKVEGGAVVVPLELDGGVHRVEVELDRDLAVAYAPRLADQESSSAAPFERITSA